MKRPDIHQYHDYRSFLKDWFEFRKTSDRGFSVRHLSREAHLASGYLPMVLGGARPLSTKALQKMVPLLGLRGDEKAYLERLREVGESDSLSGKHEALTKIQRSKTYREEHPKEVEVCQYLSYWYLVAIREMVALKSFREDPKWIQARLRYPVALKDIEKAIAFLLEKGFLFRDEKGALHQADKNIECLGKVYSIALAQFHKQMLKLASESLDGTPPELRNITGHTFAIPQSKWKEAVKMLDETLKKIANLESENPDSEAVYHVLLGGFPLTS